MKVNNISKIAIGTAQFGMSYGISNNTRVKKDEIFRIFDFAHDNGIDTIDTAKSYGNSEEIVGTYIKNNLFKDWHVITKIKANINSLENQIDDSRSKLNQMPQVVLAHSANDYLNPLFYNKLYGLKDTMGIKKIGVSLYNIDEINHIIEKKNYPDIIQLPMNIMDTKLFRYHILDKIKERSIEIHVRSVFLQGLFFLPELKLRKYFEDAISTIVLLKNIAKEASLTLAELSLLWICSLEQVEKVIIGINNLKQLQAHKETSTKTVEQNIFKKALSIKYENEKILNPSLWPRIL